MTKQEISDLFDEKVAANYDKDRDELQVLKDTLYLLMRGAFASLPDEAHVLIVGAGTGEDILYLAEHRPNWRYTVVEPAPAMMAVCREKLEKAGLADRCDFHDGFLASLAAEQPYTAAVSALVSQFITEYEPRVDFFRQIADRLVPGAPLYTADLLIDNDAADVGVLMDVWGALLASSGIPKEQVEKMKRFEGVWIVSSAAYAELIQKAGFGAPQKLYQGGVMTGWLAHK